MLGVPHRYRIDWTATGFGYFIDGVQVAFHPIAVTVPMQMLAASDFDGDGLANAQELAIDSILIKGPYTVPSGTFVSRVFDAADYVEWYSLS